MRTVETSLACASDYALESNWEQQVVPQLPIEQSEPPLYRARAPTCHKAQVACENLKRTNYTEMYPVFSDPL